MKHLILTTNFGPGGDPKTLIELAQLTEASGWDGFFLWDHLQWPGFEPTVDPWVAMGAIATATSTIKFGTMVSALPRRDIVKLARELITLDRLSDGRVVFGAGLGWQTIPEFTAFGHEPDLRVRGEMLDEGLVVLQMLISGEQVKHQGKYYQVETAQPFTDSRRIPIWVAGQWPSKKPMRRAAHWDGVAPISKSALEGGKMTPDDVREMRELMAEECQQRAPFDIVLSMGNEDPKEYEDAGVTWHVESVVPFIHTLEDMKAIIQAGPRK